MHQKKLYLVAGLALMSLAISPPRRVRTGGEEMKLGHIHLGVKDIPAALVWFERVFGWKPTYKDERIAVLPAKPIGIILDRAENDAVATLSFESTDVDTDYQRLVGRGAVSFEPPNNKPYGVRAGYIAGPGSLRIELEGPLKNPE